MIDRDYFRGDQKEAVTAPNLSEDSDFVEHIVKARGKKTNFTSVSLDRDKIGVFGDIHYLLLREKLITNGHNIIEHEDLIELLKDSASLQKKESRLKAIQAIRYATQRKEGLVKWSFDTKGVARKDMITWGYRQVQCYFKKV